MKKFALFALAGVMMGIGAASAGIGGPSSTCRSFCEAEYQACRAAATNISDRADCFSARYECYAQCGF